MKTEVNFNSFRELAAAASAFDHVIAVNFSEVPDAALPELAHIYGATLQKQDPKGLILSPNDNNTYAKSLRIKPAKVRPAQLAPHKVS